MLTKILVTALVILGCYFLLRFQRNKQAAQSNPNGATSVSEADSKVSSSFRWLAICLVVLTLGFVATYFVYDWLDSRKILAVTLTNPHNGEVVHYEVYKGKLQERSFETVQGQVIRVGNTERVEVSSKSE